MQIDKPEDIKNYIDRMVRSEKIRGADRSCEFYPCHFDGLDCTWCFCPFYPCDDPSTDGKLIESKYGGRLVWNCGDCNWIHRLEIAELVLDKLRSVSKVGNLSRDKLFSIRLKLLKNSRVDPDEKG